MDAQELIDRLAEQLASQKRARQRRDANVAESYNAPIEATLVALEGLGYDRLDCLEVAE